MATWPRRWTPWWLTELGRLDIRLSVRLTVCILWAIVLLLGQLAWVLIQMVLTDAPGFD